MVDEGDGGGFGDFAGVVLEGDRVVVVGEVHEGGRGGEDDFDVLFLECFDGGEGGFFVVLAAVGDGVVGP